MAELTVMTWNVQNLLPVGHQDGPATQEEYDAKLAALAEVIDAVEPDVLALQEVGPDHVLADLNAACAVDFDHRLAGVPDGRGMWRCCPRDACRTVSMSPPTRWAYWRCSPVT